MRSLVHRLSLVLAAVALTGGLMAAYGAFTITQFAGRTEALLDTDAAVAIAVLRTQSVLSRLGNGLTAELTAVRPQPELLRRTAADGLAAYEAALVELDLPGSGHDEAAQLRPGLEAIRTEISELLTLAEAGEPAHALGLFRSSLIPLMAWQATVTATRTNAWLAILRSERGALLRASDRSRVALVLATLIPVLAAAGAMIWLAGSGLRRPLLRLARACEALGRRDYSKTLPELGRGDEIGHLAVVLEQLRQEAIRAAAFDQAARDGAAAAAAERLRLAAEQDSLTGLPNREGLRSRLAAALRQADRHGGVSLLKVDLDHFQTVNAIHGTAAGDALLAEAARRLSAVASQGEHVLRLGGDEFGLIIMGDSERASVVAEQVFAVMGTGFALADGRHLVTSVSIGLATFPETAAGIDELLVFAKAALQAAKGVGRGAWRSFRPEMRQAIEWRAALEDDLRRALARGELALAYQPQSITASGEIVGFEALLRWTHPTRGPISPALFIPLAEEIGLIPEIGAFVLRAACREAASWPRKLRIAVNVSPLQIERSDFAASVLEVLRDTGLEASRLEVEITESMLVRDAATTTRMMNELKRMCVGVALDDFGTGYSSLSTLHNFAFDRVKVDRAFVTEMTRSAKSAALVRAVVALGHSLGLPVLAEGVETEAQQMALAAVGCEEVQGYLIGRPMPVEALGPLVGIAPGAAAMVAA